MKLFYQYNKKHGFYISWIYADSIGNFDGQYFKHPDYIAKGILVSEE